MKLTFLLLFSILVLFLGLILDLAFFPVIRSLQDVRGWKLREIVRDLPQVQKRNSFLHLSVLKNIKHPKENPVRIFLRKAVISESV